MASYQTTVEAGHDCQLPDPLTPHDFCGSFELEVDNGDDMKSYEKLSVTFVVFRQAPTPSHLGNGALNEQTAQ
jgi:hypothetical protein